MLNRTKLSANIVHIQQIIERSWSEDDITNIADAILNQKSDQREYGAGTHQIKHKDSFKDQYDQSFSNPVKLGPADVNVEV